MTEGAFVFGRVDRAHVPASMRDIARKRPFAALRAEIEAEQERWFLWVAVAFGLGVAGYFALGTEPALASVALPVVAVLVVHLFARRAGLAVLITGFVLAVAAGACIAKLRTEYMRAPVLTRQIGPLDIAGWVELVEPRPTAGQRLTLVVRTMSGLEPAQWPHRVRVRTRVADLSLAPGMAVRVKATLAGPATPAAPGDFDFARMAWFSALGGIGLATGRAELDPDPGDPPPMVRARAAIEIPRQWIGRRIVAALPGETGAIATALITGERGAISDATNAAYRDSGLFHILSISGLHMVIMAGAVFFVIRLALAAIPSIALRHPIKKWAAAGAILGAIGYLLISGSSFATVRSAVMILIMFAAVILDRPALALRNVALAALAILIVFPESLFDAGFQMSFAAVTGLVSAYEWIAERRAARTGGVEKGPVGHAVAFVGEIMLSTVIASFAVAPFAIYHFHNTQQLAMLANLVAIPICNMIVMPAALATLIAMPLGLEWWPLWVMGVGIDAMTGVARTVAALPGAVVRLPSIPTLSFALMLAGGLWLLLWSRPWRLLGLVPVAAGIALAPTLERPDILVGRDGTSVAVRDASGRYAALMSRGSAYELGRWLEADGDRRLPQEVAGAGGFRCDPLGCTHEVKGQRLAVSATPAAARDDCSRAGIIILRYRRPKACEGPGRIVVDPDDLRFRGVHAIYLGASGPRIATVRAERGDRPWSQYLEPRSRPVDPGPAGDRTAGFAGLDRRFRDPRPEIEDDSVPKGRLEPD